MIWNLILAFFLIWCLGATHYISLDASIYGKTKTKLILGMVAITIVAFHLFCKTLVTVQYTCKVHHTDGKTNITKFKTSNLLFNLGWKDKPDEIFRDKTVCDYEILKREAINEFEYE